MNDPRILFVDDDADIQAAARLLLGRRGFFLSAARSGAAALTHLATEAVDLVLLDLNYAVGATSGAEGLALLRDIRARYPALPVLVVTGHSGIAVAVAAMREGARDFIMKPWNNERLVTTIRETLARHAGHGSGTGEAVEPAMIADSPVMRRLLDLGDRLAPTRAHLLISGPPGSGKITFSRRILAHAGGNGPVILDARHIEDFPADTAGADWIVRDIERLSPALQARLAVAIEAPDAPRVLALTALSPDAALGQLEPRLRAPLDLVRLVVPSLIERGDEIEVLARHFAHLSAARHKRPAPDLTPDLMTRLRATLWPDNLRALRLTMERMVLLGEMTSPIPTIAAEPPPAGSALARGERTLIVDALARHGFNVSRAAQELGLSRPALYRRMARYGL